MSSDLHTDVFSIGLYQEYNMPLEYIARVYLLGIVQFAREHH